MHADIHLAPACDHSHGCITCGDEGIPARVVEVDEAQELAVCAGEDGSRSTVETALVGAVQVGDSLLVHAGTAIARLEEERA
ncbi:MAG TPA: HypC/HybG/HupF family hydrogenase formation chaperone [Thermoleophilaceae bacterium]